LPGSALELAFGQAGELELIWISDPDLFAACFRRGQRNAGRTIPTSLQAASSSSRLSRNATHVRDWAGGKSAVTDRIICGWRVRSLLPLPETAPWHGPDSPIDIEIRPGTVPTKLDKRNYIEVAPDGRVLLDLSPVVRFLVAPDCVVVDTSHPPEAPDWRVQLLGPVLGLQCYLRGVLPLHACAVRIGARTVAIAGRSCAGKSTLAAALMRRGHALVTDDICAISLLSARPMVLPSFPALKLARDSLKMLDIDPSGLVQVWLDI
jgi:hypothetical protein